MSSSTVPILTSSASPFDVNPEIELDARDVRVVVMQEATSTFNSAALMYDSHPIQEFPPTSPIPPSSGFGARGSISTTSSQRRISVGQASKPVIITQESTPRNFGAFDRRPSTHTRSGSFVETEGQRSTREYREEISTIANCMFGSSDVMAYKGTGSKVHILPTDVKSSSYPYDNHGSLGRSSMRSSRLAQSYTSENVGTAPTSAGYPSSNSSRSSERKRVLITRIFPVPLTNDTDDAGTPIGGDEATSYPFPSLCDDKEKKTQPKQKRTPMYAIGLVIQLPANPHAPFSQPSRSNSRSAKSFAEHESLSSSLSSLRPAGWSMIGGFDSLESSFVNEVDDRIDIITQHWDVIIRTLDHLQAVASANILNLLKQADLASPEPMANRPYQHTRAASISVSGKRVEENIKPQKPLRTNVKAVQLMPYALVNDEKLKTEIEMARQRIVGGIKTLQVVTRQGRWGIWRDEARWVAKWAGSKEEGFFFYNLLTAFLGTHTDWLEAIGPTWYRRRHYRHQRATRDEDVPIKARTIIVSNDKMAARRLIFLLSAFLPSNQQQQTPFVRQYRPGTSTSFGAYSQSPPSYVPLNAREESLRRKVNRLIAKQQHPRTMSFPVAPPPIGLASHMIEHHHRRNSDAVTTGNSSIAASYSGTKNSSLATTSTTTPVPTIPHFSTRRPQRGTGPIPRPGSSGSLAADDLIRSLKRGDTGQYSITSSDSHSRWGSMLGSFWSSTRRDSTSNADVTPPSLDGLEVEGALSKKSKRADMLDRVQKLSTLELQDDVLTSSSTTHSVVEQSKSQEPKPIHPSGAYESPVKTSINESDGIIDIDVPLPSFLRSSFGSAISSPSSSGILSSHAFGAELEGFEHYSRSADETNPVNVGGWLPCYHPDFILQAIPTMDAHTQNNQYSLEEQVKASMRAEPTPLIPLSSLHQDDDTTWITVTSALIADTTNFTIKRVRLRRLVKLRSPEEREGPESLPNSYDGKSQTQSLYGNPYSSTGSGLPLGPPSTVMSTPGMETAHAVLEEEFLEEPVMSLDEYLIEAVEKIIAQVREQPAAPLPQTVGLGIQHVVPRPSSTSSKEIERIKTVVAPPSDDERHGGSQNGEEKLDAGDEIPRGQCKKVLLGALEDIAREVAESRRNEDESDDHTEPEVRLDGVERMESFLREGIREWLDDVEATP
jgi:hypothetical protein